MFLKSNCLETDVQFLKFEMTNTEKVFEFTAAVRGYRYYRHSWDPQDGEVLRCFHELGNIFDVFAIKTVNDKEEIVGHLPREISRVSKFLMDREASMKATLTTTNYRRSPLVQGGLEIACKVTVRLPGTVKNHLLMDIYSELVTALYAEPKEEVVLGSFLIKSFDAVLPSNGSRNKKEKNLPRSCPSKKPRMDGDICVMFAAAKARTEKVQMEPVIVLD